MYRFFVSFLFLNLISGANYASQAEFVHCSDFGCKTQQEISFNTVQWHEIENIFSRPALSPWLEKQQIRQAIALMEIYSGALTGTFRDRAENYPGEDIPNQMDCIDESTNTDQYLRALQRRNLLNWHRVGDRLQRHIWLIFPHWTAVIEETHSGQAFAVDSWYRDNGEPPYIQPIEEWKDNDSFPEQLNPELSFL